MAQPTKRNVIIIGGGGAGATAAKSLEKSLPSTHQVVLIEKRDFHFHVLAALRTMATDDLDNSIMIPYDRLLKKGKIVHTTVTKVNQHDVEIEPVEGWGDRIPFDYLIFATGTTWPAPIFPPHVKADAIEHFKASRATVAAADKIVVIGAGAVGCELAGEIKEKFPAKTVTLIHSSELPIHDGFSIKFRTELVSQMLRMGIQLFMNDRVTNLEELVAVGPKVVRTASGKEIPADHVFFAMGGRPNTELAVTLDPAIVNPRGIRVLPTCQIDGSSYSHIFAVGDCADFSEEKQLMKATKHSDVATHNIMALIKGKEKLNKYKAPSTEAMVLPLGKKGGAGILPMFGGPMIGSFATSNIKGKTLFVSMSRSLLNY